MIKNFTNMMKLLYTYAPKNAVRLALLKCISVLTPIFRLAIITTLISQIERFLKKEIDLITIIYTIIIFIVVEILNSVATNFYKIVDRKTRIYIKTDKYPEMVEKIANLDYKYFENAEIMDTINRIKKNFSTRIVLSYTVPLYFLEAIITIVILTTIIISKIGLIGFIIPLISIPMVAISQKNATNLYEADEEAEKHNRYLEYIESLFLNRESSHERNLFSTKDILLEKWNEKYNETYKITKKSRMKNLRQSLFSEILTFFGYTLAIGILFFSLINRKLEYELFIAFVITILKIMNTLSYTLTGSIMQMGVNKLFLDDYNKILSLTEEKGAIDEANNEIDFVSLEYKDVSFTYPNSTSPILNGISFKIEKGKKYAFVGANGAGKTTIVKLLLKLYKADKGQILINGEPIDNYTYAQLKGIYSVVFQDFSKFPITVKEYLNLGSFSQNKEMVDIMRYVGLDKFVNENDIYDYELGKLDENSIELSGGEWQRLSLGRALLSNRDILILDEATSSIDPIREKEIYDLFKKASKDKTTIFITHRLGSTKFADVIYVIKDGAIVEFGNHDNLMEKKENYFEMYSSQSGWYN